MKQPAGWMAVAAAVPAAVLPGVLAVDPGGLSPFGPAKWWTVSTLALAAVAATL